MLTSPDIASPLSLMLISSAIAALEALGEGGEGGIKGTYFGRDVRRDAS